MLDREYRKCRSVKKALLYSKLAILELCGWVEESMDDIVLRCARTHLRDARNLQFARGTIVRRTHGFDYEKDFRSMLIQLVGLVSVERLERRVDETKMATFKATLANLKKVRDSEAHTHIKKATKNVNAPSATISQFLLVYEGLLEYD